MADHELLLNKNESPSMSPGSWQLSSSNDFDDNSEEGVQQMKPFHREARSHQDPTSSTIRVRICATLTVIVLVIVISITTAIAFHSLNVPAKLVPTAANCTVAGPEAPITFSPPAEISCGFHPSLQQQRDEECVFDPMLLAWMPKACINFALLHAFLNTTSEISFPPYEIAGAVAGQVYADSELTKQLPVEEVQQMKQNPYYVTLRFHRAHCAYMFRLVAEAAGRKAVLDGTVDGGRVLSGVRTEITNDLDTGSPRGVYVWQEAIRPMHVNHCVKVLAWREGGLNTSEKFYGSTGRCVLL